MALKEPLHTVVPPLVRALAAQGKADAVVTEFGTADKLSTRPRRPRFATSSAMRI